MSYLILEKIYTVLTWEISHTEQKLIILRKPAYPKKYGMATYCVLYTYSHINLQKNGT